MNFNVCLVQPVGYIHSSAFSELAELIAYGLTDLYHSARVTVNHVAGNATNIIIGAHLLEPHLAYAIPKSSIILNTEQLWSDTPSEWKNRIFHLCKSFLVWDYSDLNVAKLESIGAKRCRHLRIGYHRKLRRLNRSVEKDIDVLFYGSINDRRREVLKALKERGLRTTAVFGVYGRERDALIERSKVVLNLHFYDSKIFEVVRVFYLLTNGKAVVGEVGPETHIDPDYLCAIRAEGYDRLVDACADLVADDSARSQLEAVAFEAITKLPQRDLLAPLLG